MITRLIPLDIRVKLEMDIGEARALYNLVMHAKKSDKLTLSATQERVVECIQKMENDITIHQQTVY